MTKSDPHGRLTRFLDRAWDQLRDNDFRGAENSATKALELDPEAAEALTG